ncbi:mitochondrial Membrane Bound O-Acyl Transferase (MBOAT) family [Schizosaccharomyces osmophilus]|uniref:Mitochondrial Membrane Bound O-Acyl Transferase (MBOAT) family n=1 Tax=Schizosaccharomyces osmophilus TaxID=2545709 RepID=A0AAE9WF05_9SCHI|nr:mitochondrial Membrane Bound O-Acyl Transferase (MBOAT) family [Schizosaccharomyces osmophilus]WBW73553.1 mitochondrial Membrane Bound O-Acyl Transferase (MBOAT) family [Schizosaccharomyces osmophilus]
MYPFSFDTNDKEYLEPDLRSILRLCSPFVLFFLQTHQLFRRNKLACIALGVLVEIQCYRLSRFYHHLHSTDYLSASLQNGFLMMLALRTCVLSLRNKIPYQVDSTIKKKSPRGSFTETLQYIVSVRKYGWSDNAVPDYTPAYYSYRTWVTRTIIYLTFYVLCSAIMLLFDVPNAPYKFNNWPSTLLLPFVRSCYVYLILNLGYYLTTVLYIPLGIWDIREFPPLMKNLLNTKTVNAFWSTDWHVMTKPMFRTLGWEPVYELTQSKFLGSLASFLISGLYHDFAFWSIIGHSSPGIILQFAICAVCIKFEKRFPIFEKIPFWPILLQVVLHSQLGMGKVMRQQGWSPLAKVEH